MHPIFRKFSLVLLVILMLLTACHKKKPVIDVPMPTQGPNLQDMQPTQAPN